MALSAICWAVIGKCGDIDGVWIEPVTAQVMMTLLALATVHSLPRLRQSLSKPGPLAKGPAWRCKPCGGIAGASRDAGVRLNSHEHRGHDHTVSLPLHCHRRPVRRRRGRLTVWS